MNSWLLQSLPLIVPSDDVDGAAVPDRVLEIPLPEERLEPSAAVDGITPDGKFTPPAMVNLLCGVRDSPSGFGSPGSSGPGLGDDGGGSGEERSGKINGM